LCRHTIDHEVAEHFCHTVRRHCIVWQEPFGNPIERSNYPKYGHANITVSHISVSNAFLQYFAEPAVNGIAPVLNFLAVFWLQGFDRGQCRKFVEVANHVFCRVAHDGRDLFGTIAGAAIHNHGFAGVEALLQTIVSHPISPMVVPLGRR